MTDKLQKRINEAVDSIQYGKVIIEIRGEKIDVITEKREKFLERGGKEFKKG